ncbi:hypothetical protein AC579_1912 [Pseudocercospora musae]|uniref:Uncharacterized protein n=1 Tax=Pseudocercospora musae TaxID=113226 RepID=A0A139HFI6_9PEZI|nr:hypothetical protein AC579_1912 [Pseudocercospora musae]
MHETVGMNRNACQEDATSTSESIALANILRSTRVVETDPKALAEAEKRKRKREVQTDISSSSRSSSIESDALLDSPSNESWRARAIVTALPIHRITEKHRHQIKSKQQRLRIPPIHSTTPSWTRNSAKQHHRHILKYTHGRKADESDSDRG